MKFTFTKIHRCIYPHRTYRKLKHPHHWHGAQAAALALALSLSFSNSLKHVPFPPLSIAHTLHITTLQSASVGLI
ncbi:hypothetical protein M378DRAFT_159677 [Amanita muscaria Koide BX008]|uniref:Uncharacterized protein n=1 Tax=Amanita muscaria (strain Koide BX008) TaxID=946122 RepID=A0A0C2TJS9_AMAMK|nr:hypothetical protein M378DRAFT_159677 [Amanita muscaria Koide BX008]